MQPCISNDLAVDLSLVLFALELDLVSALVEVAAEVNGSGLGGAGLGGGEGLSGCFPMDLIFAVVDHFLSLPFFRLPDRVHRGTEVRE